MTPVVSDLYLLLGGAAGAFGRRWVNRTWRQRETVTDVAGSALATVLCVGLGIVPDGIRALLTVDPIFALAFAAFASAGAIGLVRSALGKYGFKWGETIGSLALLLLAFGGVALADIGIAWTPGGTTGQEDGANFAPVALSDGVSLIYTRVSTATTQLRVYQSVDGGQTVQLATSAIATPRATAFNPNHGLLLASGQTLLSGFSPGALSATPEAPWLVGTSQTWVIPSVSGLPAIGPAATAFPPPFSGGFLRAVQSAASGTTILSVVDNNSANPPVICRSTNSAASFTCAALPASIGQVTWRDPASGSATVSGTSQALASPSGGRWLLMDSNTQVYTSINDGLTWTLTTRLTTDATPLSWAILCQTGTCYALTSSQGSNTDRVFRSTDGGATWVQKAQIPRGDLLTTLAVSGGTVVVVGDPSVRLPTIFALQSQDGGNAWQVVVPPNQGWSLTASTVSSTAGNDYLSGFEELDTLNTTWDQGTPAPTLTQTNPRASGPSGNHSVLSDSAGSNNGLGISFDITSCDTLDCTMTLRWYERINSFVCNGNGGAQRAKLARLQAGGATSMGNAILAYQCDFTISGPTPINQRWGLDITGTGAPLALGTQVPTTGQWYRFEWLYRRTQSGTLMTQTLNVYLQDATVPYDTITTTRVTGVATPANVLFSNDVTGGGLQTYITQLDDFGARYLFGTALGSPLITGPAAVWTLKPTANVSVAWTPNGGSNFNRVQDVPGTVDNATTTNSTTGTGTDRFAISTPSGAPPGWYATRVQVNASNANATGSASTGALRSWDAINTSLTGPTWSINRGSFIPLSFFPNRQLIWFPGQQTASDMALWNIGYQSLSAPVANIMTAVWANVEMQPSASPSALVSLVGGGQAASGPVPFWTNQAPQTRSDGSILVWTYWSAGLNVVTTPAFSQGFASGGFGVCCGPPGTGGFPPIGPWKTGAYFVYQGATTPIPNPDMTATTTAGILLTANQTRLGALCYNSGPDSVRIGDSTVAPGKGIRVVPNTFIRIIDVGPIYAAAESTTADLSCTEDRK